MANQKHCLDSSSRGSIFLLVLVLSLIASYITTWVMESGILQWRMASEFEHSLITRKKLEAKLIQRERALEDQFIVNDLNHTTFLEFVPDTLHFDEQMGTNYYRIEVQDDTGLYSLSSTVALRNKPQAVSPLVQLDYSKWFLNNNISPEYHRNKPLFIRLKNGTSLVVVAHYLEGNKPEPVISFYDFQTGTLLKEFGLSLKKSQIKDFFNLSEFCAVDSNHQGYVDAIYVGDNSGTLWKIHLNTKLPSTWRLQEFSLEEGGGILGQIVAGRDRSGEGLLLYLLLDKGTHRSIYALWDKDSIFYPHFTVVGSRTLSNPLLRLGYLIYSEETHIKMVDAFSGERIQEVQVRSPFVFDKISSNALAPKVEEKFPREVKRQVLTSMGTCLLNVDGNRLGRRTWRVSSTS